MNPETETEAVSTAVANEESTKSSFYEQLVEHAFISELLQEAWFGRRKVVEVMRSEVDAYGYDLVLECNGVMRHVQLKTSKQGGKTRKQNVASVLGDKPGGCIVWIVREDPSLGFTVESEKPRTNLKYLFFGEFYQPEKPLRLVLQDKNGKGLKVATHTKRNKDNIRAERQAIREVPKTSFKPANGEAVEISTLLNWLFGI